MKQLRLNSSASWQKKLYSFTLIELLVVIAIIAILAAILLPTLQNARQRGLSAGCANNAKQMAASILRYAGYYDDWFPASAGTGSRWYKMRKIVNYPVTSNGTPGVADEKKAPIFYCLRPFKNTAERGSNAGTGQVFYTWVDYSKNGYNCSSLDFKITKVPNASAKFIMMEVGRTSGGIGNTMHYKTRFNVFPHNNMQNVQHLDGHVAAYPEELPYFYAPDERKFVAEAKPFWSWEAPGK
ncbi:MAG: prepilin-type N-terminal cleavage/methylation domain-containing protein [Lentisphaeria bacterium]|nr:prepilin-type N-terminal cleavage/methylation domain-containing protein [Lentisphaeria bacterium]